jgi:hypothetical protein
MADPPSWKPERVALFESPATIDVTAALRHNCGVSTNPALRSRVEARIEEMAIPAAIVLLRTPEQTWTEVFGTRRLGIDDPVTTEDHVRIGSNTRR